MIELTNVKMRYRTGVNALNNVNLKIEAGEFVYIIGPTGCGKTTLIKLLDGELIPTSGTVKVATIDVGQLPKRRVPLYRRNIGVIFQDYRLLESKTVFENIAYALEVIDMKRDKIRSRVRHVLRMVDLTEKSNAFPNELSGGQQQRVAIARAIANKPKVLIADEPTGNLDPTMGNEIMRLLEKINREEGTTIVMVTHDRGIVERYRKRTIALEAGHIVADSDAGGYFSHD